MELMRLKLSLMCLGIRPTAVSRVGSPQNVAAQRCNVNFRMIGLGSTPGCRAGLPTHGLTSSLVFADFESPNLTSTPAVSLIVIPLWGFRFLGPSAYSCMPKFKGLNDIVSGRDSGWGKEGPKVVEGQDPDTGSKILNLGVFNKHVVLSDGVEGEEK